MLSKKQTYKDLGWFLLLGMALLSVPQVCRANAAMGFIVLSTPVLAIVSFLGILTIEARIIKKWLSGSPRRAFFVALFVNILTGLAGVLAGLLLDKIGLFDKWLFTFFGAAFLFTLLIEAIILHFCYLKDGWAKAFKISFVMNFATYVFLALFVSLDIFMLPSVIIAALVVVYFCRTLFKLLPLGNKMSKSRKWLVYLVSLLIILGLVLLFHITAESRSSGRPRDTKIISAIGQARTVMTIVKSNDGNYDNFNCQSEKMASLCEEADMNYGKEDGKEPLIVHDAPINSQATCIYSPLNARRNYWYCADSQGYVGVTTTDPALSGCSMEAGARCPAGLTNP